MKMTLIKSVIQTPTSLREAIPSKDEKILSGTEIVNIGTDYTYKHQIVWRNAVIFLLLHIIGSVGLTLMFFGYFKMKTVAWMFFYGYMNGEGITIGAHRYYCHKSFKAKPLLRAILMILQTGAGQNSMFVWVRDHRLHHRYTDTDADPHNAKRGFFFSHIGWLMSKKHPLVIEYGRKIDMSDLQADWMVRAQKKYYLPLYIIFGIVLPVWVPIHFFGEIWWKSLWCTYFMRYTLQLNITWLVNSAAHLYGTRPYDKNLQPVESWIVSLITLGEGWHNYHHVFPWDYKAAEFTFINMTATIIDLLAKIGLAYDLRTASPEMVAKRVIRTGDGTHYTAGPDIDKLIVASTGPLNPTSTLKDHETDLKLYGLPSHHETDYITSIDDNGMQNSGG